MLALEVILTLLYETIFLFGKTQLTYRLGVITALFFSHFKFRFLSILQEMFKFMLTFKARLDIKNNKGLTPLTLAAELAKKKDRL